MSNKLNQSGEHISGRGRSQSGGGSKNACDFNMSRNTSQDIVEPLTNDFIPSPSVPIDVIQIPMFTLVADIKLESEELDDIKDDKILVREMKKEEPQFSNENINPDIKISHTKEEQEPYKCGTCGSTFSSLSQLQKHCRLIHPMLPGVNDCETCGRTFVSSFQLMRHKFITHTQGIPKRYTCDLCGKGFTKLHALSRHKSTHKRERRHKCELCGKCFLSLNCLTQHMSVHTKEKPYKCDLCGQKFKRKGYLARHDLRNHASCENNDNQEDKNKLGKNTKTFALKRKRGRPRRKIETDLPLLETSDSREKHYNCETCGKKFSRSATLKKHKLTHTFLKCEICGAQFSNSSRLNRHKLTHPKIRVKLHNCNICGKYFRFKCLLNQHKIIHTGEMPYDCIYCGKRFRRSNDLNRHRVIHTEEKPYRCEICDKSFHRSTVLKYHTFTHTGDTREKLYKCEVDDCGKSFLIPSQLAKHKVLHGEKKYKCELCDKRFFYSSYLERHKKMNHFLNIANSEPKVPEPVNFLSVIQDNLNTDHDNNNDGNVDPLSNLELETHILNVRKNRRKQKIQVRRNTELEFF